VLGVKWNDDPLLATLTFDVRLFALFELVVVVVVDLLVLGLCPGVPNPDPGGVGVACVTAILGAGGNPFVAAATGILICGTSPAFIFTGAVTTGIYSFSGLLFFGPTTSLNANPTTAPFTLLATSESL